MGLDGTIYQVDIIRVIDNFHFDNKPILDNSGQVQEIADKLQELGELQQLSAVLNTNDKGVKETFYWRKNYKLQDFMCALYFEKGGNELFNNVYIRLDEDDLENLDQETMFGNVNLDKGRMNEYRDFITNARIAINSGYAIYYCSSW